MKQGNIFFILLGFFCGERSFVSSFHQSHSRAATLKSLPSGLLFNSYWQKSVEEKNFHSLGAIKIDQDVTIPNPRLTFPPTDDGGGDVIKEEVVPRNMSDAVKVFFFSQDYGPLMVVASILTFITWRIHLSTIEFQDLFVFATTVLFWSFQEHFLHEKLLHSKQDWMGKEIHECHHQKPYYHISIDPAGLLLGWMFAAHIILRLLLPLPLAVTATIAYSMAGLFYEWAHYIVHTKVRFRDGFWKRVKDNHVRHHLLNHNYWFAFSLPWIDDVFGTNPSVKEVPHLGKMGKF